MLRAIQVKILKPLKPLERAVVEVYLDESIIVEGTEMLYGIAEHKELIHRLGIPRLKHLREEPEAEMRYEPRTSKNQKGVPQLALVIGVQW
jgi:hypothetical protein